ncbi:MAG: TlpA family protein disulfide reductase [Alphaproteobacteria bacterium]|nr:TlpA family protein disulfide reductase [Alphaproteobacteria bacterium]
MMALLAMATATAAAAAPAFRGAVGEFIAADPPRPAPTVAFQDAGGRELGFADFRGKVVVVNLWATWCAPCVREMPALERLRQKLAGSEAVVLAISSDRGGARQVEPFLKKHGVEGLGVWLDPKGAVPRAFGARGLPTTIILDREGREVGRLEGDAEWDGEAALALVRHYLK